MPASWNSDCGTAGGSGLGSALCCASTTDGSLTCGKGRDFKLLGAVKSKAEVRSPHTARCQGLMLSTVMPKRFSRNMPSEVWSNTCELTQPPLLQGDMTNMGTRAPRPHGRKLPLILSSGSRWANFGSEKYSPSSDSVDLPASVPSAL